MGTVQPTTRSGTAPAISVAPTAPSVYISPTTQTNSPSSNIPVVASVMPSVSNDNSSNTAGPSKSATGKRYIYPHIIIKRHSIEILFKNYKVYCFS